MYVVGLLVPVPGHARDAYRAWAERSAALLRARGCLEIVESWEDDVPDGLLTDFRRATAALPGEKIVFGWQIWPDRETLLAAEAQMAADGSFDAEGDCPFDSRRVVYGSFAPFVSSGR